jgi:hypothetical protein
MENHTAMKNICIALRALLVACFVVFSNAFTLRLQSARGKRGYSERPNLITGAALNVSGQTPFSKEFPMGEGWYAIFIGINIAITIGTGAGPITEGELLFLKNFLFRTDRGETICNLPGRALWKIAALKNGALPTKDAIAAATATYRVHIPIYLSDPEAGPLQMLRPEDTVLDTSSYNACTLHVTLGALTELFSAPGTATAVVTMDLEVERSFGVLPGEKKGEGGRPIAHINYDFRPPVDASVTQNIDIERSAEMSLKRAYVHTGSSGTGGVPTSGANSDIIIATLNIKDQNRFIEKDRLWRSIQSQNKLDSMLETTLSGFAYANFVADKSIAAAMSTADKSVLQLTWLNGTAPANSIVTLLQETIRTLK